MAKSKSGKANFSESELRAQAIALRNAGKTREEVAQSLGRSVRWVQKWWQRYKKGDSLHDKPRSGRPSCLTSRAKDIIRKAKGKRHQSCRRLSQRLKNLGETASKNTVHRYLTKKLGLKAYKRRKIPRLTKLQKEKRLTFAKKYVKLTPRDWENWVFSDECPLYLFPTPNRQNDRIYERDCKNVAPSEQVKFSAHSMVWGAMSASGLSELHIVPQGTTINAEYYINNILQPVLLPALARKKKSGSVIEKKMFNRRSELVFMQDGAPAHTARVTQQWCSEQVSGFLSKEQWPPNSPDLNPIENCWGILKSKVFASPSPTTMKQLNRRAMREWANIEPSVLKNLVHSMPERLKAVIAMKGGHTGF